MIPTDLTRTLKLMKLIPVLFNLAFTVLSVLQHVSHTSLLQIISTLTFHKSFFVILISSQTLPLQLTPIHRLPFIQPLKICVFPDRYNIFLTHLFHKFPSSFLVSPFSVLFPDTYLHSNHSISFHYLCQGGYVFTCR